MLALRLVLAPAFIVVISLLARGFGSRRRSSWEG
jgi:hypothetical protein